MLFQQTIKPNHIGIVFKDSQIISAYTSGKINLGWSQKLVLYKLAEPCPDKQTMQSLTTNKVVADNVHSIQVQQGQIALVMEDGGLKEVLSSGLHYFWKTLSNMEFLVVNTDEIDIDFRVNKNLYTNSLLTGFVRKFRVMPLHQGILIVQGQENRILNAGDYYFWNNTNPIELIQVDTRAQSMEIKGQDILSEDKIQLRINATVTYRVIDSQKALLENKDFEQQLYKILQLILRQEIGKIALENLLENKNDLENILQETSKQKAENLGIEVLEFGIKDIILSGVIKEAMNQIFLTQKKAQATAIQRREETASTRSLLNTAKLMDENPTLWRLKEWTSIEKICEKIDKVSVSGKSNLLQDVQEVFSARQK